MKIVADFGLLVVVLFLITCAGCSSKTNDPQPDKLASLIGRWELDSAVVFAIDKDNPERKIGRSGPGLAFIFYDDGSYDGCILPGSDWDNTGQSGTSGVWECTTNKPGRWALSVTKVSGADNDIDDGTLTLTAPTLPEPLVLLGLNTYTAQNRNHFYGNTSNSDANGNLIKGVYHFTKK